MPEKHLAKLVCGAVQAPRAAFYITQLVLLFLRQDIPPAPRDTRKCRQQSLVGGCTPPPYSDATSRKGLAPLGGPFWASRADPFRRDRLRRRPLLPKSSGALSGPS